VNPIWIFMKDIVMMAQNMEISKNIKIVIQREKIIILIRVLGLIIIIQMLQFHKLMIIMANLIIIIIFNLPIIIILNFP